MAATPSGKPGCWLAQITQRRGDPVGIDTRQRQPAQLGQLRHQDGEARAGESPRQGLQPRLVAAEHGGARHQHHGRAHFARRQIEIALAVRPVHQALAAARSVTSCHSGALAAGRDVPHDQRGLYPGDRSAEHERRGDQQRHAADEQRAPAASCHRGARSPGFRARRRARCSSASSSTRPCIGRCWRSTMRATCSASAACSNRPSVMCGSNGSLPGAGFSVSCSSISSAAPSAGSA